MKEENKKFKNFRIYSLIEQNKRDFCHKYSGSDIFEI